MILLSSDFRNSATCRRPIRHPVEAFAAARWRSVRHRERWIPFGGTTPLGIMGHVRAGFELYQQVREGVIPAPAQVYLPLGTGGTAAGVAVGLTAAGLESVVVAVRCGPTIGVDESWLRWLGARAREFLSRHGVPVAELPPAGRIRVDPSAWSGAYGPGPASGDGTGWPNA